MSIFEYNEEETLRQIREDEFEQGKAEGVAVGKAESILELLEDYGEIPEEIRQLILQECNFQTLSKWHKLAAKVNSIEEFTNKFY